MITFNEEIHLFLIKMINCIENDVLEPAINITKLFKYLCSRAIDWS